MSDERRPDDEESVAMKRAEEAMYIQEAAALPTTPERADAAMSIEASASTSAADDLPAMVPTLSAFGESPATGKVLGVVDDAGNSRMRVAPAMLRLLAAALALGAAIALFEPAFDAILKARGGHSSLPTAPPPKAGEPVSAVVLVDSTPSGATVTVDGANRGPTPTVFDVECVLGEPVRVRLTRSGFAPVEKAVRCAVGQPGAMHVRVRLKRR